MRSRLRAEFYGLLSRVCVVLLLLLLTACVAADVMDNPPPLMRLADRSNPACILIAAGLVFCMWAFHRAAQIEHARHRTFRRMLRRRHMNGGTGEVEDG